MKYQNSQAFYNHLKQSLPENLSSVFLIVSPCSYERRKIGEKIVAFLSKVKEKIEFHSSTCLQDNVQTVLEDLNTFSITFSTKVHYLDNVEKLKKGDLTLLSSYVESPSYGAYLILAAESPKGLAELYTKGKKEMIACDLSDEKPWELKGRLKGFLQEKVASFSKQIQPEALELLLERVGLFLPNLEKEIDKLLCYIGERKGICVSDVKELIAEQKEVYLFHLLDHILWGSPCQEVREEEAADLLFPLLSQMKTQLQQALALAHLLERKVSFQDLPFHFPQVKPYQLEKIQTRVRGESPVFFRKALDLTFEMEILAKTTGQEPLFVLDLLLAKMKLLRHPVLLMAILYLLPNLLSEESETLSLLPQAEISLVGELSYLIAESEKGARHFLKKFPFVAPKTFRDVSLGLLNEHTSVEDKKQLVEEIKRKGVSGLISDCGMPCLADPGSDLVRMCRQAGVIVKGFSGPSSLMLGLALSGLGGQKFTFHGYLPRSEGDLVREVQRIEAVSKKELSTHLFIETPYRNVRMFECLLKTLCVNTWVCVACDLTGPEEMLETKQVGQWRQSKIPAIEKKPTLFLLRSVL